MPMYKVDIDGRQYEGYYGSAPDAVFGAMLKDMYDNKPSVANYEGKRFGMMIGIERIEKKGKHKARRVN